MVGKHCLAAFVLSIAMIGANTVLSEGSTQVLVQEDSVEFTQPTYVPGDTAVFLLKDANLNSVHPCTATWVDLDVSPKTPIPQETFWNLVTGAPQPSSYRGLNDGCAYDVDLPANTPIAFDPFMEVTVNGLEFCVDDIIPDAGKFSINQEIEDFGSDLVAQFHHEIIDVYTALDKRIRVTSTSDSTGEWLGFSEIADEAESTPHPTSGLFAGEIGLSADQNAMAPGNGAILVSIGDRLRVEYLDEDRTTIISADESEIVEPAPTPTPLPSASLTALIVLGGAFTAISLWRLSKKSVATR